ncbi:MAG: type II secretion system F family protein [Victivallales bacterium]
MKTRSQEITDFYKELSILTKSNMPLPETLYHLGRNSGHKDFREVLQKISEDTAKGVTLAESMKNYPVFFHPLHVKMIGLGEKSGLLPDILLDIARVSHLQSQLTILVKDVLAYPLFTTTFAFFIFFLLMYYIVPHFAIIFSDLLEGEKLPPLTQFIIGISDISRNHIFVVASLFICHIAFSVWLLGNSLLSQKIFLEVIKAVPFSNVIFYNLSMSRICSLWSLMIKQNIPAAEALSVIAGLVENKRLELALKRIASKCSEGGILAEELSKEGDISEVLTLTLKHSPEKDLSSELDRLAELFKDRATLGFRRLGTAWELVSMMMMIGAVGSIIFILFLPILSHFIY